MNSNFDVIVRNNKEFIENINYLFNCAYVKMAKKKYDAEELKDYEDLKDAGFCLKNIIHSKNGNVKEALIKFENVDKIPFLHFKDQDLNNWLFEIKKNNNNVYDLKLKEVEVYLKGVPIKFMLNIKKENSYINFYKKRVPIGKVELTKSKIDQEFVELIFITKDIDISFLKNLKVENIIYDYTSVKEKTEKKMVSK